MGSINMNLEYDVLNEVLGFKIIQFKGIHGRLLMNPKGEIMFPRGEFVSTNDRDYLKIELNNDKDIYKIVANRKEHGGTFSTEYFLLDKDYNLLYNKEITNIISTDEDFHFNKKYIIIETECNFKILDRKGNIYECNKDTLSEIIDYKNGWSLLYSEINRYMFIINKAGGCIKLDKMY